MASLKDSPIVQTVRANISNYTVVIAMVLIWALFGALTDGLFLSARNISNLFRQATLLSFLATGMVLVIVTGNIDLSVGSITGFTSVVAAALQVQMLPEILPGLLPGVADNTIGIISTVVTILVVLVIAFAIGVYQGSVIAYLGVPAFIVTLGGMQIFRGGVLGVTQGRTIAPIEESLRVIAQGYVSNLFGIAVALLVIAAIFYFALRSRAQKQEYGFDVPPLRNDLVKATLFSAVVLGFVLLMNQYRGVQVPVLVLAVFVVGMTYVSNNTRFGRYCYAIGGNEEASRLSGVNIKKIVQRVHILSAMMAGVTGIMLTGYVAAGTTTGGLQYELDTVASCVIGGTSLMGGRGTIFGGVVGALIMGSIVNGMSVMNMDIFWQYIVRGLVLIAAVYLDVSSKSRK